MTQQTTDVIQTSKHEASIAEETGYSNAQVSVIKNTVAKGTTNVELAYFLMVCKSHGLNPFHKEIWCYKDSRNNLLVFAGRDGFLKKAQESDRWNGMISAVVFEKDEFQMDVPNANVTHIIKAEGRGKVLGAYAIIKPKGVDLPTVVYVDIKDYDKGYSVWKTNKPAMIIKVAETHALKKAFGIAGLQSEYDFTLEGDHVKPVSEVVEVTDETEMLDRLAEGFEMYQGEDKLELQRMVSEKLKAGEATIEFLNHIAQEIGLTQPEIIEA